MWDLFFEHTTSDVDATVLIPLIDTFKTEGDWLKAKRKEIIEKDKYGDNRMLVNNPNRSVTLNKPTVLIN